MRGTMIWFNADKGHGFIRTEEDERLIVHADGFTDGESRSDAAPAPTSPSTARRSTARRAP